MTYSEQNCCPSGNDAATLEPDGSRTIINKGSVKIVLYWEKEMEEKEKDIDMILELLGKATKEKVADILVFIKYYLMQ